MKIVNAFVIACCAMLLLGSCGQEGAGLNLQKDFTLDLPITAADFPTPDIFFNPPGFDRNDSYSLEAVEEFKGKEISEIVFRDISYGIEGISSLEEIGLDSLSLTLHYQSASVSFDALIDVKKDLENAGQLGEETIKIRNLSRTAINVDGDSNFYEAAEIVQNGGEILCTVHFDFAEVPEEDLSFNFNFYFDAVAKVRTDIELF